MTENNFSFTPMANEDISIHIGSVPGVAAESGAPVASASPVSAQQPEAESIFGEIPAVPTQEAVDGILFDFNDGIRILFPQNRKEYHVVFSDSDTGVILFSQDTVPGAFITSVKKFYICFQLAIYEKGGKEPLFTHDFGDARGLHRLVQLCGAVPAETPVQADLRHESMDNRHCKESVSGYSLHHAGADEELQTLRLLSHGAFLPGGCGSPAD